MLEIVTLPPAGFNRPSGRSFERDLIPILLVNRVSLDCFALPHEKTRQRSGRRSDGGVDEGTKDLLGELPILGQMTAASTNSDAYLPVHPGAAATMAPSRVSSTNWGNAIFLAPMIFGGLVSVLAAAWKFLRTGETRNGGQALDVLYTLGNRIRNTEEATELVDIEREIDKVLQAQRARSAAGEGKCARRHDPERCRPSPAEPDPRSPDSLDRAAPRKNPGVRAR